MADLDLDPRREALGKGPVLTFKGQTFELAAEMPYALVEAYREHVKESEFCALILGEHWEQVKALGASMEDIREINKHDFWGVNQGESEASGESSQGNGTRSRPTSSGSTGSTSAKRSGVKKRSASGASSP
jgi:hypothetical protein